MEDDRPLSSEDMIRQAREELDLRPSSDHLESPVPTADPDEDPALVEEDLPIEFVKSRPQRPSRRQGALPDDPFVRRTRSGSGQPNPRALAVVVAVAMLVIGIAIAIASFSAAAP